MTSLLYTLEHPSPEGRHIRARVDEYSWKSQTALYHHGLFFEIALFQFTIRLILCIFENDGKE